MSFKDDRGLRHSTTVYASSVLEAAALGLKQLRDLEELLGERGLEADHTTVWKL